MNHDNDNNNNYNDKNRKYGDAIIHDDDNINDNSNDDRNEYHNDNNNNEKNINNNDNRIYNNINDNNNNNSNNNDNNRSNNNESNNDNNSSFSISTPTKAASPIAYNINDYRKYIAGDRCKLNEKSPNENRNGNENENFTKNDVEVDIFENQSHYLNNSKSMNHIIEKDESKKNEKIIENYFMKSEIGNLLDKNLKEKHEIEKKEKVHVIAAASKEEKGKERNYEILNNKMNLTDQRLSIDQMENIAEEHSLSSNKKADIMNKKFNLSDWSVQNNNNEGRTYGSPVVDNSNTDSNHENLDLENFKYISSATDDYGDRTYTSKSTPTRRETVKKNENKYEIKNENKNENEIDRKSTRLNSSHALTSRMPSSA